GVKAMRLGVDVANEKAVSDMLDNTEITVKYENGGMRVIVDGEDLTPYIRENGVSKVASDISAYPKTREKLLSDWRAIAEKFDVIMDGRDIGTVVLPNSKFKFFITADSRERARRRVKELQEMGQNVDFDTILQQIEERDYNDSHRKIAPLKQAEDALLIDSTNLTKEEVVEIILSKVKEGLK
ncbi:MAG: (d)CMP kinase, partial [Clostridia bacterium]|nr:(d)CMP kinase [Clostridia bacterium]